jgi:hypothetical protein
MRRNVLAVSLFLLLAVPLAAQRSTTTEASTSAQSPAQAEGYKSPGTATLISVIVPGGGSMYAGKTGKGLAILGTSAAGVALSIAGAAQGNTGTTLGGLGLEVASWIYGITTASGDARDENAKRTISIAPLITPGKVGIQFAFGH